MNYIKDKIIEKDKNNTTFTLTELYLPVFHNDVEVGVCEIITLRDSSEIMSLADYLDQCDIEYVSDSRRVFYDMDYGNSIPISDSIFISSILLNKKGLYIGKSIINEIISYAKERGFKNIYLRPQPLPISDYINNPKKESMEIKLINWYSKFGFKCMEKQTGDIQYMRLELC